MSKLSRRLLHHSVYFMLGVWVLKLGSLDAFFHVQIERPLKSRPVKLTLGYGEILMYMVGCDNHPSNYPCCIPTDINVVMS